MNTNQQPQIPPTFSAFADFKYRSSSRFYYSCESVSTLDDDSKSLLIRHTVINMHLRCAEENREILARAGDPSHPYLGVFEALRSICPTRRQYISSLLNTMPEVGVLVARLICNCDKYTHGDKKEIRVKLKTASQSADDRIKATASMRAHDLAASAPKEFSLLLRAMYFSDTSAIISLAQKPDFRAFAGACSFMHTFDTGTGSYSDLDRIVSEVCPSLVQYAKDYPDRKGTAGHLLPMHDSCTRGISTNLSQLINFLDKNSS
jgi:hypothetical protein